MNGVARDGDDVGSDLAELFGSFAENETTKIEHSIKKKP